MGKFVPPIDQINKISPKKSRKSFSDLSQGSIFKEVKKVIKESYSPDAFAQVGQMNAVVLEVIEEPAANMLWKSPLMSYLFEEKGTLPDYIEVRFRIPEMHAHLPEPKDQSDWAAINRHPKAMMKKEKGTPSPGDIVVIDFQDKNNFQGAVVVETLDTNLPVPNGGGQCSIPEVMNSANPFLGLSTPTGDQVTTDSSEQSIKNNPAREAFEEGIEYPQPHISYDLFQLRYLVSINEFNSMEEFRNTSRTVEILGSKNVFSVCFTTSENDQDIRDISRLTKVCSTLKNSGFKIGFRIIVENGFNFNQAYIKLYELIKTIPIDYLVYELRNQGDDVDSIEERKELILSIGDRFKIEVNYLITEKTISPNQYQFDSTKVAINDNHYDYAKIIEAADTEFSKSVLQDGQKYRMYYMGGINFIKWAGAPCLFGERTGNILKDELIVPPLGVSGIIYLENYGFLREDIMGVVIKYSENFYSESEKQSFLSSDKQIQTPKEQDVENISVPTPTLSGLQTTIEQPPEINSDVASSQDPQLMPAPQSNLSPGLQCSPAGMGGQPFGEGSGTPAPPPSIRFDQLPGSENLGWTVDASKIVNNIIVDFMNRMSSAIYRRVPTNSPAIAGSAFKKVRVTSTMRDAATQVRLMWDKIDVLGENGVWDLYGDSRQWVKEVVYAYRENRNSQRAIGAVQANIDRGIKGGSRGHNYGSGVDIHTWSHIKAEGLPHSGISESQMMQSAYVRAVVEAAKECGGKPIVEAYQQHIHITIL